MNIAMGAQGAVAKHAQASSSTTKHVDLKTKVGSITGEHRGDAEEGAGRIGTKPPKGRRRPTPPISDIIESRPPKRPGTPKPPIEDAPKLRPKPPIDEGPKLPPTPPVDGDTKRPHAPDGQHYEVDPGTGKIGLEPDIDNLLWTDEHQRIADRGWHYGVDPGTGEIVQQPNVDNLLATQEDMEIAGRGWHYALNPETGRIERVQNVQPL